MKSQPRGEERTHEDKDRVMLSKHQRAWPKLLAAEESHDAQPASAREQSRPEKYPGRSVHARDFGIRRAAKAPWRFRSPAGPILRQPKHPARISWIAGVTDQFHGKIDRP